MPHYLIGQLNYGMIGSHKGRLEKRKLRPMIIGKNRSFKGAPDAQVCASMMHQK
jgi:hypothetical protein